jgi:transcriptional regulator with XRE-family HTH domain
MLTIVVTRIRKGATVHLFIKEHMDAKGISDDQMAGRLGVDRVTVWRRHSQQHRLNPQKIAAFAHAMGMEPEDLYRPPMSPKSPPPIPSIDAMLRDEDEEIQKLAFDIVRRVISRKQ